MMKSKIDKSVFERSGPSRLLTEERSTVGTITSAVVLKEFETLLEAIKAGHLDARADLSDTSGTDRRMLGGINEMLDAVIGPLNVAAEYVDRISKGDIPEKITDEYKGDFNEMY
jgi:methyl-accepting chemotaxis protein